MEGVKGTAKSSLPHMSSLIVFANSLGPDQARQNVGPDLVSKCLTLKEFLKEFLEKLDFEKKSTDDKNAQVKNSARIYAKHII